MVRAASASARLSSVVRPLAAVASYVALCADDLVAAADAVQVPNAAAARRRGGEGVGGKCCDQRGYQLPLYDDVFLTWIPIGRAGFSFWRPQTVIQLNLETAKLGGRTNFGIFV